MKILYLSHRAAFPPNKGEKIRSYNQIAFLVSAGYELIACSPLENDEDETHLKALGEKLSLPVYGHKLGSKPLRLFNGLINQKPLSVSSFYSAQLQKIIDDAAEKHEIDLIFCSCSSIAEYVFRSNSQRIQSARKLMDFMDLDSDKWKQYAKLKPFPMNWVYKREAKLLADYEVKICNAFDACFFIAEPEIEVFKGRVKDVAKVSVIGNGLDTDFFFPRKNIGPSVLPRFIFTGVMDYFPNEDAVVWFCESVWEKIKARYPQAEFVIAGMNPSKKIQELAKLDGVEVTGFVDDIVEYYHKSDIFVAPFRIARGVQNKILQAFACGLPVVSSSLGAEGIECVDSEHLLVADTPDMFFNAISELVENGTVRNQLSSNALALVQRRYSWEGNLRPLQKIIG